jgi:molybdopterin molybdotransferase
MNRPDIKRLPKRADPLIAQKQLLEAVKSTVLGSEKVKLKEVLGRVLSKDIFSNINIPSYNKTFIDGYAIKAQKTGGATPQKPVEFTIVGRLFPADFPTAVQVAEGEAVYVACGAPIPEGADATVKVEETRLNGERIEVVREIGAGEGIIPLGDDVQKNAKVFQKGHVLRPQDAGLLASLGLTAVEVLKKPQVAILSGGDELIKQSQKNPAVIANNYALVIAGLASELGADARIAGIMPDAEDKVQAKIREALAESDIVLTIGGSSVGIKDFVPDAINALGKPGVIAQGVLLRPGAVSGFGVVDGKPVVMLPGHIGSCIAGFYMFAAPLINQLSTKDMIPRVIAELTVDVNSGPQYLFMLTHLTQTNGVFFAEPVKGGSSALSTIVKSNGYTIVPPHTALSKGEKIIVSLFGRLELTQFTV